MDTLKILNRGISHDFMRVDSWNNFSPCKNWFLSGSLIYFKHNDFNTKIVALDDIAPPFIFGKSSKPLLLAGFDTQLKYNNLPCVFYATDINNKNTYLRFTLQEVNKLFFTREYLPKE